MNRKSITAPITDAVLHNLRSGDLVSITGVLYTARDKAHERIRALVAASAPLPVDLTGQILYYVGPTPAPPGHVIGSAGPTTSGRMDPFTETILGIGVKGMIGKGRRDVQTCGLLQKFGAVYFSSYGGAGAYLSKRIIASSVVAFEDLGPEAVYRLEVKDFPAIVVNDIYGGDLYEHALRTR